MPPAAAFFTVRCIPIREVAYRLLSMYTTLMKVEERRNAIRMRRHGKTYAEILARIPVAKSTLSLWLRSVHLARRQKQQLTKKRRLAGLRGALARRRDRLAEVHSYIGQGRRAVGTLSNRELWLIGVALYWAEGSKQHESTPSAGVMFGNSDVRMIRIFLYWLRQLDILDSEIYFELYVHENRISEVDSFRSWWSRKLGVRMSRVDRVYLKRHRPLTNRMNTGDLYRGLLRIKVSRSTTLNRKINGWIEGIVASLGDRLTVGQLPLKQ